MSAEPSIRTAPPGQPTGERSQPGPGWRALVAMALALLALNALLSFNNWWPTPAIRPDHRLAPEFVWLWVLVLGWTRAFGPLGHRLLAALAMLYLLLVLGRYADVTVPALFGRPVHLFWDGQQLPRLLWVLIVDRPWWVSLGAAAAVLASLAALYAMLHRLWRFAAWQVAPHALRSRAAVSLSALAFASVLANHAGASMTWSYVSRPLAPNYWYHAQLVFAALWPAQAEKTLPPSTVLDQALADPAQALGALQGRDVYLLMMETVGAVSYDDPRGAALAGTRSRFEQLMRERGMQVVSAFYRSPTFAGGSDLAHLSVLTGLDVHDHMRHDILLGTQRPTLNALFRAQGYETFGIYHSVRWPWPERSFYGYDHYYDGSSIDYRGPPLGHWLIPDQYAAAWFERAHPRTGAHKSRFVFFPSITCHFPFSPVPPYQSDWSRLLGAEPFDAEQTRVALATQPNWLDMAPDYFRMVDYTYRWMGDFVAMDRASPSRRAIYVLIGDHQPTANITGANASWDVPVHVVSADPALLARLRARGFHDGMQPPRQSLGRLNDLTPALLSAFASAPAP